MQCSCHSTPSARHRGARQTRRAQPRRAHPVGQRSPTRERVWQASVSHVASALSCGAGMATGSGRWPVLRTATRREGVARISTRSAMGRLTRHDALVRSRRPSATTRSNDSRRLRVTGLALRARSKLTRDGSAMPTNALTIGTRGVVRSPCTSQATVETSTLTATPEMMRSVAAGVMTRLGRRANSAPPTSSLAGAVRPGRSSPRLVHHAGRRCLPRSVG